MEQECEAGPKNLWNYFRVEERFSARNALRYFPV